MPSSSGLRAIRAIAQHTDREANRRALLEALRDHPGQPTHLSSSGLSTTVRYDGLEARAPHGAEPRYSIYLYSLGQWLSVSEATLEQYLAMYGPYTYTWADTEVPDGG